MINNPAYCKKYDEGGATLFNFVDAGFQQTIGANLRTLCDNASEQFLWVSEVFHKQQVGAPSMIFIVTHNHLPK